MKLKNYLLNQKTKKYIFAPYLALNDPDWDTSFEIISSLFQLGADTIELGLPFTDPVADGPILQRAFSRILNNDFKINDFFDFLKRVNIAFPDKPLLVMGYANIFYQLGIPTIFKKLANFNVQGVIIPDILQEQKNALLPKNSEITLINFITPTASKERIQKISQCSDGFLYVVSSKGVTGKNKLNFNNVAPICKAIKKETDTPILIGFGIREKEQINQVIKIADGFIIGSLIHEIIESNIINKKNNIVKDIEIKLKELLP